MAKDKKKKKELLRRLREFLVSKTGTGKVGPGGLGSAKQIKDLEAETKRLEAEKRRKIK